MAKSTKNKKEELVTTRKSVHVIFLSCSHCGEETDHIESCSECGETMRVIDVVEKFGEDAERFLKRMQKRKENGGKVSDEDIDIDDEEPNIILMGGDTDLDDDGIDPTSDDEEGSLDIIYPSDDDDTSDKKVAVSADDDLTKALEQLDEEEDENISAQDFGFDDGEIPEL
jgi:hypothetical protein